METNNTAAYHVYIRDLGKYLGVYSGTSIADAYETLCVDFAQDDATCPALGELRFQLINATWQDA